MLTASAELLERLFQIPINTLSFARVARSLAHAGLSSAIVALMDATDILRQGARARGRQRARAVLEVMVCRSRPRASSCSSSSPVPTAEGRIFRPLPSPPSISEEKAR
jgi:hypothetical protein